MTAEQIILRELLEKYHRSRSFCGRKESNRRILLHFNKQEFPDYDYNDSETKRRFNEAVKRLQGEGIISVSWHQEYGEGVVVKEVWLNLIDGEVLPKAYEIAGMEPLSDKISLILRLIQETKTICQVEWIACFLQTSYDAINTKRKLTDFWKNEITIIKNVLHVFTLLPQSGEEITERAFSLKCFNDSKYFEKHIEKYVLAIAKKHEPRIKEWMEAEEEIGEREILAQLGILKRNEIYEFCGDIQLCLENNVCDCSGFKRGAAISSAAVDDILSVNLMHSERILFIENKTNYEEYIKKYRKEGELVIYHGGFYSPQKAKFFSLLKNAMDKQQIDCMFWADIDLGGFLMFDRLKKLLPNLHPYKMSVSDYNRYKEFGLKHSETYFKKLAVIKTENRFSIFVEVIELILSNEKTIEQEVMLNDL